MYPATPLELCIGTCRHDGADDYEHIHKRGVLGKTKVHLDSQLGQTNRFDHGVVPNILTCCE